MVIMDLRFQTGRVDGRLRIDARCQVLLVGNCFHPDGRHKGSQLTTSIVLGTTKVDAMEFMHYRRQFGWKRACVQPLNAMHYYNTLWIVRKYCIVSRMLKNTTGVK